jgi:hypothetical protein
MSQLEELLRTTTRESAAEVSPGEIRPLDLSGVPFDRPWLRGRWRGRRGRGLRAPRTGWARLPRPGILVPVLAALTVVAVVAASLALPRVLSGRGGPVTPALRVPAGVPPYYAALAATGTPAESHPVNVAVRDTWTGRPLATVTPPPGLGTFSFVAGGAVDDRTWVVGAQPWKPVSGGGRPPVNSAQPLTFFLLTFEPGDRVIRLRQLPGFTATARYGPGAGTAQPPYGIEDAALSPDGSRLAVATWEGSAGKTLVHVTPVAPGVRGGTWILPGRLAMGGMRNPVLSWTADNRVLSIATWQDYIFLDPAKPSGDLLAASRVVPFTGKAPTGITYSCGATGAVMSLDGTTMTCGGSPSTDDGRMLQSIGILTISARTGRPLHYLPIRRYGAWVSGPVAYLAWASPAESGTYIALPLDSRQPPKPPGRLTVWRHGKVAGTIPLAKDIASLLLSWGWGFSNVMAW